MVLFKPEQFAVFGIKAGQADQGFDALA